MRRGDLVWPQGDPVCLDVAPQGPGAGEAVGWPRMRRGAEGRSSSETLGKGG